MYMRMVVYTTQYRSDVFSKLQFQMGTGQGIYVKGFQFATVVYTQLMIEK